MGPGTVTFSVNGETIQLRLSNPNDRNSAIHAVGANGVVYDPDVTIGDQANPGFIKIRGVPESGGRALYIGAEPGKEDQGIIAMFKEESTYRTPTTATYPPPFPQYLAQVDGLNEAVAEHGVAGTNGIIGLNDEGLQDAGIGTQEEADFLIDNYDADGNGVLDESELEQAAQDGMIAYTSDGTLSMTDKGSLIVAAGGIEEARELGLIEQDGFSLTTFGEEVVSMGGLDAAARNGLFMETSGGYELTAVGEIAVEAGGIEAAIDKGFLEGDDTTGYTLTEVGRVAYSAGGIDEAETQGLIDIDPDDPEMEEYILTPDGEDRLEELD